MRGRRPTNRRDRPREKDSIAITRAIREQTLQPIGQLIGAGDVAGFDSPFKSA
jgi:hypothetical protein